MNSVKLSQDQGLLAYAVSLTQGAEQYCCVTRDLSTGIHDRATLMKLPDQIVSSAASLSAAGLCTHPLHVCHIGHSVALLLCSCATLCLPDRFTALLHRCPGGCWGGSSRHKL